MVHWTVEQLRRMMDRKKRIRNISVIAHVDHGKSTLTDSLIAKAGIIARAQSGEKRFMDTRDDEQLKSITIKSTSVSLCFERERIPYLVNLIDSPGHVDFSSEVTAALRVTDGALVVVDCAEGVCVQTETVLRQAIVERVRPVLFLNKLDRVFLELHCSLEDAYRGFRDAIESVNVICATYQDERLGLIELLPQSGNVGFGSGLQAWAFTLADFGRMYSAKFGVSQAKMMEKLWGEHFWDPQSQQWVTKNPTGKLQRGFCQFVLHPIKTLFEAIMAQEKAVYGPIIEALGLKFSKKDLQEASKRSKDFLKLVMRTWIPAGDALLDMIADHLPSPVVAQAYRVDTLYSGPLDSPEAHAVRTCDSSEGAPMSMYVSKMVPTADKSGRFIAFGRVFSGTIRTGQPVRIMGPDHEFGTKKDLHLKRVQRTVVMMGRYLESVQDCPAGNVCGLLGIDQCLVKSGTLTTSSEFHPFITMKFSVAAVVQIAVECVHAADLPKLVEGLKRLAKSDPLVKVSHSKTGQHIIGGAGELHLEVCMKDLREDFMKGYPVRVSDPIVSFAETVSSKTGQDGNHPSICVAKSPNKHNRMYVEALPMCDGLIDAIESGSLQLGSDMKAFARTMTDEWGWKADDARRVWTFGCPPDAVANTLVDLTKGVQYASEIKDSLVGAFMQCTEGGILCDETMRGIRFNVLDLKIHSDPAHRGANQIMPCAKRALSACQIASGPRLLEPMYLVDIVVPQSAHSGVYRTLNAKRGLVESALERPGTPLIAIKAFLPVIESFGFTELLRKNTGGRAFPQMKFSHWSLVSGDPFKKGTQANTFVVDTRKRKGLKADLPVFADYFDRI